MFFSGFMNSCNLTITTILFPMLIWLWIYPPNVALDKKTNFLVPSISRLLKITFSWLIGFVSGFVILITIAMILDNNQHRFLISLSGIIFAIIAYLNWKFPHINFRIIIPSILGFCLAIGWLPSVSSDLASILLASLERKWSALLFINAFTYSSGVGIALCFWLVIIVFVVFACKNAFLRTNAKLRITSIKNKIINSHVINTLQNRKFTKEKWYASLGKFSSVVWSKVFTKSNLHLIMVFYGVLIFSGLLEWIQLRLLVLIWSI